MFDKVIVTDENNIDEVLERLRVKGNKYKIKTIKSGKMLEVLIYPVWDTKSSGKRTRANPTRLTQEKLNLAKAQEKCVRLVNSNFITGRHLWLTLTYNENNKPLTLEEADKNIKNYINRLKAHCKRNNLPELKYVYSTEHGEVRTHHHVIINTSDMNIAESLWSTQSERARKKKNPAYDMELMGRVNVRRLQEDDSGLEGLARYVTKSSYKNRKRFCYSRNLEKPIVKEYLTLGGQSISKNKIKKLTQDKVAFENLLKKAFGQEYALITANIRETDFIAEKYLSAKLKQIVTYKETKKERLNL